MSKSEVDPQAISVAILEVLDLSLAMAHWKESRTIVFIFLHISLTSAPKACP